MTKLMIAAAVAVLALAPGAGANGTIWKGTGSFSKGQVQSAFGWNNAQLQSNAPHLTIEIQAETIWTWSCSAADGRVAHGSATEWVTTPVSHTLEGSRGQIKRFVLTGLGAETAVSPDVVGACQDGDFTYSGDAKSVTTEKMNAYVQPDFPHGGAPMIVTLAQR